MSVLLAMPFKAQVIAGMACIGALVVGAIVGIMVAAALCRVGGWLVRLAR